MLWWCGYRRQRTNRCRTVVSPYRPGDRRVPWSTKRGDCRLDAGHDGACKPAKR